MADQTVQSKLGSSRFTGEISSFSQMKDRGITCLSSLLSPSLHVYPTWYRLKQSSPGGLCD